MWLVINIYIRYSLNATIFFDLHKSTIPFYILCITYNNINDINVKVSQYISKAESQKYEIFGLHLILRRYYDCTVILDVLYT